MQKEYFEWLESATINSQIKGELFLLDESEIDDAFYKNIEFGTAGLRGKMGPGTNRINHYVIAKATLGFLDYLISDNPSVFEKGIVIAYDNRKNSQEFAALCANLCASKQIKSYIFESPRPTPQLSYMIRHLESVGGINITASHNSKEYNGFKIYDSSGAQFLPDKNELIVKYIENIKDEIDIEIENFSNNEELIYFLDSSYDDVFLAQSINILKNNNLKTKDTGIVYTPLHGTGSQIIPKAVELAGFNNFFVEKTQMILDPDFSTCEIPNPEDFSVYTLAIEKADELDINYVLATDPDADRVGVCVRNSNKEFKLLSGNELGALIANYIFEIRKEKGLLKDNSLMIDTIVSSDLTRKIAENYEVKHISVLTGFKYIADLVNRFEKSEEFQFEFGYEESLGFLASNYVRDKDAISSTLLIVEMINYYESQGLRLNEVLSNLYTKYGYYINKQISIVLDNQYAQERIEKVMDYFRNSSLQEIDDYKIVEKADYEKQILIRDERKTSLNTYKEKTIKIILEDESWIAIRPSGTEPKLKMYIASKSLTYEGAKNRLKQLQDYINNKLEDIIE